MDTRLVYVTAIRHPDSVADYDAYWAVVLTTLRALARQEGVRVVAAGNLAGPLVPGVDFFEIDLPCPGPGRRAILKDKANKFFAACHLTLTLHRPDWVFTCDCDDFVWGGLPGWLASHPHPVGYRLSQGYLLHGGRMHLIDRGFCKLCGSSTVWNAGFLRRLIPRTKSWEAAARRAPGWLLSGLARHGPLGPDLERHTGHRFGVIHEPMATYRYGTGFNVSSSPAREGRGRLFAAKIAGLASGSTAADPHVAAGFGISQELLG
jgi:hypothetical protein